MSAIAPIKLSSFLTSAAALLGTTGSAGPYSKNIGIALGGPAITVGVDVSVAGSPGNLDPEGFLPNGISRWVDRSGGIQIGYPSFTLSSRPPSKTSRVTRVFAKYTHPVMEITSAATSTGISPAPTKAYDNICNIEFVISERTTLMEREKFYSRCVSLFLANIWSSDLSTSGNFTGSPLPGSVINLDKPY